MTTLYNDLVQPALPGDAFSAKRLPIREAPFELLREWKRRRRYRAELRRLLRSGVHLIPDVGLEPGEALLESGKPFWRK